MTLLSHSKHFITLIFLLFINRFAYTSEVVNTIDCKVISSSTIEDNVVKKTKERFNLTFTDLTNDKDVTSIGNLGTTKLTRINGLKTVYLIGIAATSGFIELFTFSEDFKHFTYTKQYAHHGFLEAFGIDSNDKKNYILLQSFSGICKKRELYYK